MAEATRLVALCPPTCAVTWSPTLIPLTLVTFPVTWVELLIAAVTLGPAPDRVIEVLLIAVTRPLSMYCSPPPFPPSGGRGARLPPPLPPPLLLPPVPWVFCRLYGGVATATA